MTIILDALTPLVAILFIAALFSIFGAIIFWLTNKLIIKRNIAFIYRYLLLILMMVIVCLSFWGISGFTQFLNQKWHLVIISSLIQLIVPFLIGIIVLSLFVKWLLKVEFKKALLTSSIVIVVFFTVIFLFFWLMTRH